MNRARTMAAAVAAVALLSAADVHAPHAMYSGRAYTRNFETRGHSSGAMVSDSASSAKLRLQGSHGTTVPRTGNSLFGEQLQDGETNELLSFNRALALSPTLAADGGASGVRIAPLSPTASFSNLNGGLAANGIVRSASTDNVDSMPGDDAWVGWTDVDDDDAKTDPSSNGDDTVVSTTGPTSPDISADSAVAPAAVSEPGTAALMLISITALGFVVRRGAMPSS